MGIASDCLKIINDKYFITLPRKKLETKVYGSLEIEDTLPISEYIYNLIYEVQKLKEKIGDTSEYLFSKKFVSSFGKIKHRQLEYWTSETQLNVMINKFYDEIVIKGIRQIRILSELSLETRAITLLLICVFRDLIR